MKNLLVLLLVVVTFAGCNRLRPQTTAPQTQQQAANELSDISAAIATGQSARCTMTKTDGSETITYAVKGKKVRVTGLKSQEQGYRGSMILDETMMYTWDETTNQGVKMTLPSDQELKDIAEQNGQDIPDLSSEEERQRWESEGYQISCSIEEVDDSEFVPPSDVTFTDMSAMMESLGTMTGQDGQTSTNDQEQMQQKVNELLKQYQAQ